MKDSTFDSTSFNKKNSFDNANWLSKLFFTWIFKFLRESKQTEKLEDLCRISECDESQRLGNELERKWNKHLQYSEQKGEKPQLLKCIMLVFGKRFIFLGVLDMVNECVLRVLQPICLRLLIQSFMKDSRSTVQDRYLYAGGLCLSTLLYSIVIHTVAFRQFRLGMQCRIALSVMVYRKSLRLSLSTLGTTNAGQVSNLLSTDVTRFDNSVLIPYILIGPTQLLIFSYLLWTELEWHTFSIVGIVAVILPLQFVVFRYSAMIRLKISDRTDERARVMNEVINAINIIKMYAWEQPFSKLVHRLRKLEVGYLTLRAYLQAFHLSLFNTSAKIITLSAVLTFVLASSSLTADKIFFCVSIANIMLYANLFCIPSAAAQVAGITVSMQRLQTYLLLEEMSLGGKPHQNHQTLSEPLLQLKEASAGWTHAKLTLNNLNVTLSRGQLVIVVGSVGSGKSSFLNLILSELPVNAGNVAVGGALSYASQEAWCFSGTIRENILFGQEYEEQRFKDVVRACELEEDFKQWPNGAATWVGERGMSLSGGQKARVNLARCLYRRADIYLLDDPLSAVDVRVGKQIFQKSVQEYLKGRLRILVTHQLRHLPEADHIILLEEGKVAAQGSYDEIRKMNLNLLQLSPSAEGKDSARRTSVAPNTHDYTQELPHKDDQDMQADSESSGAGNVSVQTYMKFFKSSNASVASVMLCVGFIISQVLISGCDYWLSFWTTKEEDEEAQLDRWFYLYLYIGLVAGAVCCLIITTVGFFKYCMRIAVHLHDNMFSSVVRAQMAFFHKTPSGRVMNRFTKDLVSVDELLPETLYNTIQMFCQLIGVIVIICISNYYIIIPTCVILVIFYMIRRLYIVAARNVKRIEAQSRSQLFTCLSTSMQGLPTIRSSNSQPLVNQQFEFYQDLNSSPFFLYLAATRWFAIWLEITSVVYLITITLSFFIFPSATASGNIGLAISSAMVLTLNFQLGMRASAETENNMISVERILEYSAIQPELQLELAQQQPKPNEDWPNSGHIEFSHVSLHYGDKRVLNDLTFEVRPKEKVGVIGRSGAGKSSIITALYRLTQPEGDIRVDGINTSQISLHDLRRNISIIPQDPVLFSGSLRYNLDPFEQFQDIDVWAALEEVNMKEAVESLDFAVTDSGYNFSMGQRQLLCLARAILRKNKIIVMDEATANVDERTDADIQKTIRTKFSNCTIITIAHRLQTVMDCDRILVMDRGSILEFDSPLILLENPFSALSAMKRQTGKKVDND